MNDIKRRATEMAHSGDKCERCDGFYIVVNTVHTNLAINRYLGCRACGHRPVFNKLVELKKSVAITSWTNKDTTRHLEMEVRDFQ